MKPINWHTLEVKPNLDIHSIVIVAIGRSHVRSTIVVAGRLICVSSTIIAQKAIAESEHR